MTLTDLFDEVSERGWLVSNLFQLDSGVWQANLRTSTHHTDFGRGPTPEIALQFAIDAIGTATESEQRITVVNKDITFGPEASKTLAQILANLRQSKPPLFTRKLP